MKRVQPSSYGNYRAGSAKEDVCDTMHGWRVLAKNKQ